jgi:anti-sigma B factor antagonist
MFQTTEIDNVIVLSVHCNIMADKTVGFSNNFIEIEEKGKNKVVVNLDKCGYISSAGMALLIRFKKRFMEKGGDLKVTRLNTVVKTLFKSTNLSKIIEVFNSVESAVASFQTNQELQ